MALTEDAALLLHETARDSTGVSPEAGLQSSRQPRSRLVRRQTLQQVRLQASYLRMVSITESFTDRVSEALFDRAVAGTGTLVQDLARAAQLDASNSWQRRTEAFKNYHGILLAKLPNFDDQQATTVVRNSIAHGLGSLTSRQRTPAIRKRLAGIDVKLRDDTIVLDETAVRRCLEISLSFIAAVDDAVIR